MRSRLPGDGFVSCPYCTGEAAPGTCGACGISASIRRPIPHSATGRTEQPKMASGIPPSLGLALRAPCVDLKIAASRRGHFRACRDVHLEDGTQLTVYRDLM